MTEQPKYPYEDWDPIDVVLNVEVSRWESLQDLGEEGRESWSAQLYDVTKESTEVGHASMYLYRFARMNGRFYDLADEVDSDAEYVAAALTGRDLQLAPRLFYGRGDYVWHVLVIDRFKIDPAWRGRGYGAQLIRRAVELILPYEGAIVATYPAPIEVEHDDRTSADWDRVRRFWTRHAGFAHHANGVVVKLHAPEHSEDEEQAAWRRRIRRPWPKGGAE